MFGRNRGASDPSLEERGFINYDNCQLRDIHIVNMVFREGQSGDLDRAAGKNDVRWHAGNGAELTCPRSEDGAVSSQYGNHPDMPKALASLRELASQMICSSCVFAAMTPLEASTYRRDLLASEIERLELEQRLNTLRQAAENKPALPIDRATT
jgi:hypothetical protein